MRMRVLPVIVAVLAVVALAERTASAGAFTAVKSGSWCDPATWGTLTTYPGSNSVDTATISGVAVTVNCPVPNGISGVANSGGLSVAAPAQITFTGTGTFGGVGSFSMTGGVLFIDSTTTYNMTGGTFSFTGGTINGPTTTAGGGAFTLSPGVTATLTAPPGGGGGGFGVGNGLAFTTQVPITYNATAGGTPFGINGGAVFTNNSVFTISGDAGISSSTGGTFVNNGTVTKTAGTAASGFQFFTGGVGTYNSVGPTSCLSGTLAFGGNGSATAPFNAHTGTIIDFTGGTYNINTGSGFSQSAGSVRISGADVVFNINDTLPTLLMTGGNLDGPSVVTVNSLTWTGGFFAGSGKTILTGAGTLSPSTGGIVCGVDARTFENDGTVTYTPSSVEFTIRNFATWTNNGTFTANGDGTIFTGNGGATIDNFGTFQKTGGTAAGSLTVGSAFLTFTNRANGIVRSTVGTLLFDTDTGNDLGSFDAPTGTIGVGAGFNLSISGGTASCTSGTTISVGGNLNVNQPAFTIPNVVMAGGTVTVATGSTLTVGSIPSWANGTFTGAGQTTVTGATSVQPGTFAGIVNTTFNNMGAFTYTPGSNLEIQNGTTFNNSGTFTVNGDGFVGTNATINNSGTLVKSAGTGTFTMQDAFNNATGGTLQSSSGTISLTGTYTDGGGTIKLSGGNVTSEFALTLTSGTLTGNGTFTAPSLTNGGTVSPGISAAGTLNISGAYTQTSAGTLAIDIGGTTAGTQYDVLAISGSATLGGTLTLSLINSFSPLVGQSFQVMTFASKSGDFSRLFGVSLAGGTKTFQVAKNATNVTILATNLPSGDANGDGVVAVSDVFYLINGLFANGAAPVGDADANGDGTVGVSDVFYLINYLFANGPAPK